MKKSESFFSKVVHKAQGPSKSSPAIAEKVEQ